MFGDSGPSQKQTADNGAVAVQAAGDVTINTGLAVAEVRELCVLFLRDNFPKLREEAMQAAEQHVQAFAQRLEAKIADRAATLDAGKFRDPEVQGIINDAVQETARRGDRANADLLTDLIAERVTVGGEGYRDLVLAEAVKIAPRLTPSQIAFITFVHFVKHVRMRDIPDLRALDVVASSVQPLLAAAVPLSNGQRQYIQYTGACAISPLVTLSNEGLMGNLAQEYAFVPLPAGKDFVEALNDAAPIYASILGQFVTENMVQCELTSVGQAIAIANLRTVIIGLDYGIWLK